MVSLGSVDGRCRHDVVCVEYMLMDCTYDVVRLYTSEIDIIIHIIRG